MPQFTTPVLGPHTKPPSHRFTTPACAERARRNIDINLPQLACQSNSPGHLLPQKRPILSRKGRVNPKCSEDMHPVAGQPPHVGASDSDCCALCLRRRLPAQPSESGATPTDPYPRQLHCTRQIPSMQELFSDATPSRFPTPSPFTRPVVTSNYDIPDLPPTRLDLVNQGSVRGSCVA